MIVLSLAKHKPSAGEKRRISAMLDELDALLVERQINAPYFGSLEGSEYVDGKARIFLSCPDADALVKRLRSWLTSLGWSGRVTVTKRYGEYADPNAAEEVVEL